MRIFAISGSLRAGSTNTALLRATARLAPEGTDFRIFVRLGDLPHFSPERDDDPPEAVQAYRAELRAADAVIVCTPEYAHGMPGSLKNALDWVVGSGEFSGKPVGTISASPSADGGRWAHASLVQTLTVMDAQMVIGSAATVAFVRSRFDGEGNIGDSGTARELRALLESLAAAVDAKGANCPLET
jgi:chromate reductase